MYIFSVVYGIAVSANQSTYVPSLASLTEDPQKMGIRFGMVETLCAFSVLAGPPTAGAIIDRSGGEFLMAQNLGRLRHDARFPDLRSGTYLCDRLAVESGHLRETTEEGVP